MGFHFKGGYKEEWPAQITALSVILTIFYFGSFRGFLQVLII